MSKYTTEVRFICENANGLTDSAGFSKVNDIIQGAIPKIFDFDFPIYDESYRNVLCSKILKHYYTREIGLETVGLWKFHLDMRLNEIMPYYNQLYRSAMIEFNPMYDIDLTTTMDRDSGNITETSDEDKTINTYTDSKTYEHSKTTNYGKKVTTSDSGNSSNVKSIDGNHTTEYGKIVTAVKTGNGSDETNNDGDSTQRDLYSDTPQGALDNVENQTYLTNARKNTTEANGHSITETSFNNNDTTTDSGNDVITDDITDTTEYNFSNSGSVSDSGTDNATDGGTETNNRTVDGTVTKTGNTKLTSTEDYTMKILGKSGGASYSKMLQEFRETFINIDRMIIHDLRDLFLNLW